MPRFTLRISDGQKEYYLHWSGIADTPLTNLMTFDEYVNWYRSEYSEEDLTDWLRGVRNSISEEQVLRTLKLSKKEFFKKYLK